MSIHHKIIRLSQQRSFVSSLFGLTFFAACLTVSASNILPCPVRPNKTRFAEEEAERPVDFYEVQVVKRPRRWIEEKVLP